MRFYPIINFDFGEAQIGLITEQDILHIYELALKNLATIKSENIFVEFSFISNYFTKLFPRLMDACLENQLQLAFGTITSVSDAHELIELCKTYPRINDLLQRQKCIEVFSPAFSFAVYKSLTEDSFAREYFSYIPGIFTIDDYRRLPTNFTKQMQGIKIFPATACSSKDLLHFMQTPFPELKRAENSKRLITDGQLEPKDMGIIASPGDYLEQRDDFIINPAKQFFIKNPDDKSGFALARYLRQKNPELNVVLAGIKNITDQDTIKLIDDQQYSVATRVLRDLPAKVLAGK
jgi:hypothetical protein